jgi:hypothetical protein
MIVPYLRGYGKTRFLSSETFRNGQPSALAVNSTVGGPVFCRLFGTC